MTKIKIYIAGPMTGIPEFNFPAFFEAEKRLQDHGWTVFNPARNDQDSGFDMSGLDGVTHPEGFDYTKTLLADLDLVARADAVYMLTGWNHSKGACAEHALAHALGKEMIYQPIKRDDPAALTEKEQEVSDAEVRLTSSTGGQKGSKPQRYDLIPVGPLRQLAELYGFGATKYDDNNWQKGYDWKLSYAAAQRHLNQFWGGEDLDSESGLPHVISAAWHCFALSYFIEHHPDFDPRKA